MTICLKKAMLVLSTTLLSMQAFFMPLGMVYAETIMNTEEQEQVELPPMKNYLKEEQTSDPRFFFTRSRMQGTVEEPLQVTFFSDQEVSEVQVILPEEATLIHEQLATGVSVKEGAQPREWLVQSERPQNTFVLPLVFETTGSYELSVKETTAQLEISEQELASEEVPAEETEASVGEPVGQEETEDYQESEQPEEKVHEPVVETPQEQQADEEETDETSVFDGETAEVTSFEELRLAIANSEVGTIEVRSNLTRSGTSVATAIGTLSRSVVIKGNGFTINFGADNGSLGLNSLAEDAQETIRIENATITKTGETPIFNAAGTGAGWSLELENITEGSANAARLASIPEGSVIFTGGINNFVRTSLSNVFIQAKQIEVNGGANVTIDRGNSWVLFSNSTISNSKITVTEYSTLTITTASGTGTPVELRGADSEIHVNDNSTLDIRTQGTTTAATNTTNNAIAMTGSNPTISVTNSSTLTVSTTNAKRGIVLIGATPSFNIEDSSLAVTSATAPALHVNGVDSHVYTKNSEVNITTTSGRGIDVLGSKAQVEFIQSKVGISGQSTTRILVEGNEGKITSENTEGVLSSTTGWGMNLSGGKNEIILDKNSKWDINSSGTSQNISIQSDNPKLHVTNSSSLTASSAEGVTVNFRLEGTNPELKIENKSSLSLSTSGTTSAASDTTNNAIQLVGESAEIHVSKQSILDINVISGNKRGVFVNGGSSKMTIRDESDSTINSIAGNAILMRGADNMIAVESGASLATSTQSVISMYIEGIRPKLKIDGDNSRLQSSGNSDSTSTERATIFLGFSDNDNSFGAEVLVSNGGIMEVASGDLSPALGIRSRSGRFSVLNSSEILLKNRNSNNAVSPLRFLSLPLSTHAGYEFLIDNSSFKVEKDGGDAAAIRMAGGGNSIIVRNGGVFSVNNPGNSIPTDPGSARSNQGIHYTNGGDNSFYVQDPGSEVIINATYGAAIDMENVSGEIEVLNGGYFKVSGRTATAAAGIFNAGDLTVNFDNPLFMDFRNNRVGGGNIFNNTANSVLEATNSDLAVWRNESNLDGDPDLNFETLDFSFSGTNFNTLGETSKPEVLNTDIFGTTGLTDYSRLSSNNGRWAIADELRVPTNADKKIHGRVSLPVGLHDSRPAWDDEATVTVEVESPSGEKRLEYTTKTVGNTNESPGISIYGEEPRGGLFEIDLDEPLEAGSKVRISKVELTSGELTEGFDHQILTDTVEVFPIVPPKPAKFSSEIIAKDSAIIQGTTENKEAEVTATHNGEVIDTKDVVIDDNGNFQIDLSTVSLEMEDEIQVFLRDSEGSAEEAGAMNPPETNNDRGNINPATELTFHDVTFEPATLLTVGEVGPVSPVDPMEPEIEVNPENPPILPEDQGQVSIDFVSQFNFGKVPIKSDYATYNALPQRLLGTDGTVSEEERPNYIQISDRRSEQSGWELSASLASEGFLNEDGKELVGAQIRLENIQMISADATAVTPEFNSMTVLTPGQKRSLASAKDDAGSGTWIQRYGDFDSMGSSVKLEVPRGANPDKGLYQAKINWELSFTPTNE